VLKEPLNLNQPTKQPTNRVLFTMHFASDNLERGITFRHMVEKGAWTARCEVSRWRALLSFRQFRVLSLNTHTRNASQLGSFCHNLCLPQE